MSNFKKIFSDSVFSTFNFLISDYGFVFKEDPETVFTARNDKCEVMISWDRPLHIAVMIKPPYYYKPSLDLNQIVHYFNDKTGLAVRNIKEEEIADEMSRMAQLLKEYCMPMLKGDFSEWHKIRNHYDGVQK
ncbi:MAG: hypothetical protein WC592_07135 [Candidatus Omnitrophota bacterium]